LEPVNVKCALKYHVFNNLGRSIGDAGKSNQMGEMTGWDNLLKLSESFCQGAPLSQIDSTTGDLENTMEKSDETIRLIDEKEPLFPKAKNWAIKKYNENIFNRVIFYLILVGVIDYYLYIGKQIELQYLLSTFIIPILAAHYLVGKSAH